MKAFSGTITTADNAAQPTTGIVPPSLNRPIIAGLVAAISTTCREHARQWEALRSLWNHGALTWEEFQWLEHLEIVMGQKSRESEFGITALPGYSGWDEIVSLTNAAVADSVQFEKDRLAHGLQAAFDLRNQRAA